MSKKKQKEWYSDRKKGAPSIKANAEAQDSGTSPTTNPPELQLKSSTIGQVNKGIVQGKFSPVQRKKEEKTLQQTPDPNSLPTAAENHNKGCGCSACGGRSTVQRKEEKEHQEIPFSMAANNTGTKTTLPGQLKQTMEQAFQQDFSGVDVRKDSEEANTLGAQAFTRGNEVHFAPGQFKPDSKQGKEMIGHEFAHVAQQREGRVNPTSSIGNQDINDSASLENEADRAGRAVSDIKPDQLKPAVQEQSTTQSGAQSSGGGVAQGWGFLKKAWKGVKGAVSSVGNAIGGAASSAWEGIKGVGRGIGNIAGNAWEGIKGLGRGIGNIAGKAWNGIKGIGQNIAELGTSVWDSVVDFGGSVWEGIKKAGGWVADLAGKVWNGITWVAKQTWSKIEGIGRRIWRFVSSFPSRAKRLLGHLWKGVKSLEPWSLDWWKKLGEASTWKDFGLWLGEFAIYGLETLGVGEIYETLADIIKFNTRGLTGEEVAKARKVFGSAIDYPLVRVDNHALLGPSWTDRAYVSFHTINAWGPLDDHTLIHELTHVWQYERLGAIYMPKAIHAQGTPEGYNYTTTALQSNDGNLDAFNLEQQGQILADYYIMLINNPSDPLLADYEKYAQFAQRRG